MTDPRSTHPPPAAEPPELAEAIDVARAWIDDLMHRLGWHEKDTAFYAMLACLHGLRDALPKDEAIHIGLMLPVLVRGFYFDGWRLSGRSSAAKTRAGFLERIHDGVRRDPAVDPEHVARAVMAMLSTWLPAAEVENAKAATPHDLHGFWPN
jgi:uncharacterized protein (DUF2267 family)